MNYNATTGDYEPLENSAKTEPDLSSSSTESESESEVIRSSSPESQKSSKVAKSSQEDGKSKEARVLSDGEISSPSPPPPPTTIKGEKKRRKKDYDRFYYLDDAKSKKKLKREKNIPCIRLVVHKSDSIELGKLFIATLFPLVKITIFFIYRHLR